MGRPPTHTLGVRCLSQGGSTIDTNVLYYGDNLDILRRYIPDGSVDLVYLDPPFNSDRNYNVIFKDESGRKSDAQLLAFEDTWHWGPSAEATYAYLTETGRHQGRVPGTASTIIAALRAGIGENQMMAYLVEMAVRLVELRRVLKPTGSLYLHCDPTASHYLKVVLDAIFGPQNFRNELIWKRATTVKGNFGQGSKLWGPNVDSLLFYTKSDDYTFNQLFTPYSDKYMDTAYRFVEPGTGRRYRLVSMIGPGGAAKGNPAYEVMGVTRYWRYSREKMQDLLARGLVVQSRPGTVPNRKYYLDEGKGVPVQTLWDDIPNLQASDAQRLGYPTQKPIGVLDRIITAASNEGDWILDPFCGCGTALVAAQKLDRKWIGIDVTYLAIAVMRARLKDTFGLADVEVIGQPTEVEGARQLAQSPEGRYQFQWWALGLVDAQPVGGVQKKGADKGMDGVITFSDERHALQTVVVSVKSGHVNSSMVRDLKGTIDREQAAMGLFLTLEESTRDMNLEASTAGLYHSELWNRDYPKIQVLSIQELLAGQHPELPPSRQPTFQKAQRHRETGGEQKQLFERER